MAATRKRVKLGDSAKANAPLVATPKKARQKATKRKSKNDGKLARVMDMPLEVFTEIASYMSPNDLLQLARSSKALRAILMSKNSKHVWEAARVSMDIPGLHGFSEPHYADLLFSKRCHGENCEDRRATKVSFALGIQLCKQCLGTATVEGTVLRRICRDELGIWSEVECHGLLPSFPGAKDGRVCNKRFLNSTIRDFAAKIEQCRSSEETEKAIMVVKVKTKSLNECANVVEQWCAQQAKMKHDANAALCAARRKRCRLVFGFVLVYTTNSSGMQLLFLSVEERLLALGYSEGDFDASYDKEEWKWGTLLDQPRLLTETIWKKILPQLEETLHLRIPHIRPLKRNALVRSIESRFLFLWEEMDYRDENASINPDALYESFPEFKAMLDDPECRERVPASMWDSLEDRYEGAIRMLVREVETACAVKMKVAYQLEGQGTRSGAADEPSVTEGGDGIPSILSRATSFFRYGRGLMSYAGILKLRADTPLVKRKAEWHKDELEVPEGVVRIARALLRDLSLPEDSSMLSLERLGRVFYCHRCLRYEPCSETFAWSGLVQHFYKEDQKHNERVRKRNELDVAVPLRNEHTMPEMGDRAIFARMEDNARKKYASSIGKDDGVSYLDLTDYALLDWGYSCGSYCKAYLDRRRDMIGYETDEEIPTWENGENNDWTTCKLCTRLGFEDKENQHFDALDLGNHMKQIHGTDFDGKPLVSKSKRSRISEDS